MTTAVSRVEVVRVNADHLPALTEFYRRAWDPQTTVEKVEAGRAEAAAANPASPGEAPPTWLVLQDGEAIAHVTTIPIIAWLEGRDVPAHWVKGLWVLPEHQRSAAGFLVLKAAVSALDGLSMALVHEPAAIRLFQALGYADLGALPNKLRLLRAGSLLSRFDADTLGLRGLPSWLRSATRVVRPLAPVLGLGIDAATSLWARVASASPRGLRIEIADRCDRDGVDALWAAVRQELRAGPARARQQLVRRYGRDGEYRFVHVRSKGALVGLAVVKRPRVEGDARLNGIRVATISDIVYSPHTPRVGAAVLRGAEEAAAMLNADAVLCGASAAAIQPLLRRRGYLSLPANLHVLARYAAGEVTIPPDLADWWVTRGDSEGDSTF